MLIGKNTLIAVISYLIDNMDLPIGNILGTNVVLTARALLYELKNQLTNVPQFTISCNHNIG